MGRGSASEYDLKTQQDHRSSQPHSPLNQCLITPRTSKLYRVSLSSDRPTRRKEKCKQGHSDTTFPVYLIPRVSLSTDRPTRRKESGSARCAD
ncbi:hypothetical protein E2C01_047538 [Portunus trituberculatus]|uniref:Uncharacterized protein n=1 Tax=Portunus trituberculatus TaxID=210409 RepID=A0A5B7G0W0_PORTR|nr:hypothetical protein [Portunus trituberculatus]